MSELIAIDSETPDPATIEKVVQCIKNDSIVAYPTETFYGLGVDVTNDHAVKHLFDLKRRDYGNPIAVIVADRDMLQEVVADIPDLALALMEKYWPGPLTILFKTNEVISKWLTTNTGKIGIRVSSNPIATAITKGLGKPLSTTSANLSGFPPSFDTKHLKNYFSDKIDIILDAGELPTSRGSTVVDVSRDKMVVIREGDIAADEIFSVINHVEES